jgi:hypothetical protein
LAIGPAELEEALVRGRNAATRELGPAPRLVFDRFFVMPELFLAFEAASAIGRKAGTVHVSEGTVDVHGIRREDDRLSPDAEEAPWRRDESWRQLVDTSWARVRPFNGDLILERSEARDCWVATYSRLHGNVRQPDESFVIGDDGTPEPVARWT